MIIRVSPTSKFKRWGLLSWSKLFFAGDWNFLKLVKFFIVSSQRIIFLPIHTIVAFEMCPRFTRMNGQHEMCYMCVFIFEPEHSKFNIPSIEAHDVLLNESIHQTRARTHIFDFPPFRSANMFKFVNGLQLASHIASLNFIFATRIKRRKIFRSVARNLA